jgi:hypothetical protein
MVENIAFISCSSEESHLGKYPVKSLDKKEIFKCPVCNAEAVYDPDDKGKAIAALIHPHFGDPSDE